MQLPLLIIIFKKTSEHNSKITTSGDLQSFEKDYSSTDGMSICQEIYNVQKNKQKMHRCNHAILPLN